MSQDDNARVIPTIPAPRRPTTGLSVPPQRAAAGTFSPTADARSTAASQPAGRSAYLADHLAPTARNLASAAKAVATIATAGWVPLSGYPGSDKHWPVGCLLCGWEGPRFYSHLRRGRPVFRHDGCLPQAEHAAKLARLAAQTAPECHCTFAHPTTPEQAAEALKGIAYARQVGDGTGLTVGLARLLGPCPAAAARAAALAEASR